MEVLGFQVLFFFLILISGLFGRKARNLVVIGSLIFTVIMVFMTWLIILQFFTIIIAYIITEKYVGSSEEKPEVIHKPEIRTVREQPADINQSTGGGCVSLIIGGGILLIILKLWSDKNIPDMSNINSEYGIASIDSLSDSSNYSPEISLYPSSSADTPTINLNLTVGEDAGLNDLSISNKEVIYQFITAENERNLETMFNYFSESIYQFWNISHPYPEEIKDRYNASWSKYEYTNTEIIDISELSENYYHVKVRYEYNGNIKVNTIYFEFDDYGKINAIY